jgi:hyperosmotically inducible protein
MSVAIREDVQLSQSRIIGACALKKNLSLENILYTFFLILSLAFISLMIVSLAVTSPLQAQSRQALDTPQPAQPPEAAVAPKKTFDREEVLKRVRAKLAQKIRKELVTLPNHDVFDNLLFSLDENYVVTLQGQARLPTLKSSAERVVSNIEGVRSVVNQVEVLPTSAFDDDIRRAAFLQIYSQSQLSRYALRAVPTIHIIVNRGRLTLEGIVATESDKILAGIRANLVPNVFEVVNNLRVEESQQASK